MHLAIINVNIQIDCVHKERLFISDYQSSIVSFKRALPEQ